MNDAIGYFGRENQGILVGVVHPVCIYLGEDNVSCLLRCAPCGVYTFGVHHSLRWMPRFLGISVMHMVALASLIRPPEYGKYLTLGGQIFSTFLVLDRTSLVGVSTFGYRVFARSRPSDNSQFNRPLLIHNPGVNTRSLCASIPRVGVCLLLSNNLQIYRPLHIHSPRVSTGLLCVGIFQIVIRLPSSPQVMGVGTLGLSLRTDVLLLSTCSHRINSSLRLCPI